MVCEERAAQQAAEAWAEAAERQLGEVEKELGLLLLSRGKPDSLKRGIRLHVDTIWMSAAGRESPLSGTMFARSTVLGVRLPRRNYAVITLRV